jgi:hypothetical protein
MVSRVRPRCKLPDVSQGIDRFALRRVAAQEPVYRRIALSQPRAHQAAPRDPLGPASIAGKSHLAFTIRLPYVEGSVNSVEECLFCMGFGTAKRSQQIAITAAALLRAPISASRMVGGNFQYQWRAAWPGWLRASYK